MGTAVKPGRRVTNLCPIIIGIFRVLSYFADSLILDGRTNKKLETALDIGRPSAYAVKRIGPIFSPSDSPNGEVYFRGAVSVIGSVSLLRNA
jgi:hypothetical protein